MIRHTYHIGFRGLLACCLFGLTCVADAARERSILQHGETTWDVIFSPRGRVLFSAGTDGTLKDWDLATGKLAGQMFGSTHHIYAMDISPDGNILATGGYSSDNSAPIYIWSTQSRQQILKLEGHETSVTCLAFSPDGSQLATGDFLGKIRLWNMADGKTAWTIDVDSRVNGVAFDGRGKLYAVSKDGKLQAWDLESGQLVYSRDAHDGSAKSVVCRSEMVATAGLDGVVQLWNQPELTAVNKWQCDMPVHSMDWSSDGQWLCVGTEENVQLWNAATGVLSSQIVREGLKARVSGISFSPDSKTVAAAAHDGTVRVYDIQEGRFVIGNPNRSAVAPGKLSDITASLEQDLIWCVGDNGFAVSYRASDLKQVSRKTPHKKTVWGLALSANENILATGAQDLYLTLTDLTSGRSKQHSKLHKDTILKMQFLSDGQRLVTAGREGLIRIWKYDGLKLVSRTAELDLHKKPISALSVSAQGNLLASGDRSGQVVVWNIQTGSAIHQHRFRNDPIKDVLFSADAKQLWIGTFDGKLMCWDLDSGLPDELKSPFVSSVMDLEWTIGGKHLLIARWPSRLEVWDAEARELVSVAVGKTNEIRKVVSTKEGRIVTAGMAGKIDSWRLSDLLGRSLRESEPGLLATSTRSKPPITNPAPQTVPLLNPPASEAFTRSQFLSALQSRIPSALRDLRGTAASNLADQLIREAFRREAKQDWHAAAQVREKIFWLRSRAVGFDDFKTGTELQRLVIPYLRIGKRNEAKLAVEWAMSILENIKPGKGSVVEMSLALAAIDVGYLNSLMGDLSAAETAYLRAYKILRASMDEFNEIREEESRSAGLVSNIGMSRQEAREQLRLAGIPVVMPRDAAESFINSCMGLGDFHTAVGNSDAALKVLQEAEEVARNWIHKDGIMIAKLRTQLGFTLMANSKQEAARDQLLESVRLYEQAADGKTNYDINLLAALQNLAIVEHRLGNSTEALKYYERVLTMAKQTLGPSHVRVGQIHSLLGEYHTDLGDYTSAEHHFQLALKLQADALRADHPNRSLTQIRYANMLAKRQDWQMMRKTSDAAIRSIHSYITAAVSGLSDYEQQGFFGRHGMNGLDLALGVSKEAYSDRDFTTMTLEWITNFNGLSDEIFASRVRMDQKTQDPASAKLHDELRQVRDQLSTISLQLETTTAETQTARQQASLKQRDELIQRERQISKQVSLAMGRSGFSWVAVDDVRRAIPNDAALISYQFHRSPVKSSEPVRFVLRAWVLTSEDHITTVELGDAKEINRHIAAVRRRMADAPRHIPLFGEARAEREIKKELSELAALLIAPLDAVIGKRKRWIIAPSQGLWLVPWAALPLDEGDHYAIERHVVQLVTSGRDLLNQSYTDLNVGPPVVLAAPDFDLESATTNPATENVIADDEPVSLSLEEFVQRNRPAGAVASKWKPLPGAAREGQAALPFLKRAFSQEPQSYFGAEATETALKKILNPQALLAITHGYFTPQDHNVRFKNPFLRCGLVLAGANRANELDETSTDDGIFTGLQILGLQLTGTELVVLSACDTAIGDLSAGSGVQGLLQAFRLAGAERVVATLWQIPDSQTEVLMSYFWQEYAQKPSAAEALREAQTKLIQTRRDKSQAAHPFFWAAFSVTGTVESN